MSFKKAQVAQADEDHPLMETQGFVCTWNPESTFSIRFIRTFIKRLKANQGTKNLSLYVLNFLSLQRDVFKISVTTIVLIFHKLTFSTESLSVINQQQRATAVKWQRIVGYSELKNKLNKHLKELQTM